MADLPTVAELTARPKAAYAGLLSYRDRGEVVVRYHNLGQVTPFTHRILFTTHFIRPDRFRFEFRDLRFAGGMPAASAPGYTVWQNGREAGSWWALNGAQESGHLRLLIAAATGVSGGSAHTVPSLLLPRLGLSQRPQPGWTAEPLHDPSQVPPRPGIRQSGDLHVRTTWLDADGLIRSVDEHHEFTRESLEAQEREVERAVQDAGQPYNRPHRKPDPFTSESTTTYHPEANPTLDAAIFDRPLDHAWPDGFA